jgi:copper amine oxidase-like protein
MIKKLVSLAIVGVMSISMLTGCGVNDLGYLKYTKDLSNITEYSFENTTTINVSEEMAGEEFNVDFTLDGEVNLEDLESMYMSFDLLFKVNDMGIESPMNFKVVDNKVYVSKNSLLEVITLARIMESDSEAKVMQEVYDNDLKDVDYILLTDLGDVYNDMSYKEMSDSGYDYLTKAFKGFDSKIITKTSKGYSIELSSENALTFIQNLFTYLYENKTIVFDETVSYVKNLYSNMEVEGFTEEDKQEMFVELEESREDFYEFIDEAALFLASGELDTYIDMIEDSKIKSEIYKEGKKYIEKDEVKIVYEGIEMGSLVSETIIFPEIIEKTQIEGNIVEVEKLEGLLNTAEDKINPIQKMELEWYPGDEDAMVTSTRLEGNTDFDIQPYTIIDGRIYLPLRYIGEAFGEEVSWEDATKTAYIVRGAEKIEVTGILFNSKTMIKVRDFEKLGYKVEFVQDGDLSIATILK